jgi:hypothetical protein
MQHAQPAICFTAVRKILRNFAIRGYVLDKERFKNGRADRTIYSYDDEGLFEQWANERLPLIRRYVWRDNFCDEHSKRKQLVRTHSDFLCMHHQGLSKELASTR